MNLDSILPRLLLTGLVAGAVVGAAFYANQRHDPFQPRAAVAADLARETWPGLNAPAASTALVAPAPAKPIAEVKQSAKRSQDNARTEAVEREKKRELEARKRAAAEKERADDVRPIQPVAIPAALSATMSAAEPAESLPRTSTLAPFQRGPASTTARFNAINNAAASIYYPDRARERGIPGQAVVDCAVSARGSVSDCRVVLEQPRNQGFGAAAARIAREGGGRAATFNGEPVDGGRAQRTVIFRP